MDAQLQSRLSGIERELKRYGNDIARIRSLQWDQQEYPNHGSFTAAKREDMKKIGDDIANLLEELNTLSIDGNSSLKKIEKVWAYGIRQLAIADARAASAMAKTFRKGDRSAAGQARIAWALIRGSNAYFWDDGK